jgi:hypothetical protein
VLVVFSLRENGQGHDKDNRERTDSLPACVHENLSFAEFYPSVAIEL